MENEKWKDVIRKSKKVIDCQTDKVKSLKKCAEIIKKKVRRILIK